MSLFDCRAHLQSTYWHDDGQRTEHILQTKDGIIKQERAQREQPLREPLHITSAYSSWEQQIAATSMPRCCRKSMRKPLTQPSALEFLKAAVTSACDQSVFTNCTPRRPVIGVPQARVDPHGVALQVRHAGVPST
nr:PREDICTED: uncharacterized protein LOC108952876 [Musa acuminata subsp. malaccensis]